MASLRSVVSNPVIYRQITVLFIEYALREPSAIQLGGSAGGRVVAVRPEEAPADLLAGAQAGLWPRYACTE